MSLINAEHLELKKQLDQATKRLEDSKKEKIFKISKAKTELKILKQKKSSVIFFRF